MRCKNCQEDMIRSKVGWLCANCGGTGHKKPHEVDLVPSEKTSKAGKKAAGKPVARVADQPAIASLDFTEPVKPAQAVTDELPPAKRPAVKSEPKVLPVLKPETHPRSGVDGGFIIAIILMLGLGALAGWLYFAPNSPLKDQSESVVIDVATMTPSVSASPAAMVLPSATPTATPAVSGDAATRDAQRRSALANYAAAFSSTRTNGFFAVAPAKVLFVANDPTTNVAYIIQTTDIAGLGQIYYRAGGKCTGANLTPGSGGSRYLSLSLQLETNNEVYCVDVK